MAVKTEVEGLATQPRRKTVKEKAELWPGLCVVGWPS